MRARARRAIIVAASFVAVLVTVLVVSNWGTFRDHLEAWKFQLTRTTRTIHPLQTRATLMTSRLDPVTGQPVPAGTYRMEEHLYHLFANETGCPVVFDPERVPRSVAAWAVRDGSSTIRETLEESGCCIIEQHFPRRAYVVINPSSTRASGPEPGSSWNPPARVPVTSGAIGSVSREMTEAPVEEQPPARSAPRPRLQPAGSSGLSERDKEELRSALRSGR
jgi:hypothetical protein